MLRRWRRPARVNLTLPVAENLNRFAAAFFVLSFIESENLLKIWKMIKPKTDGSSHESPMRGRFERIFPTKSMESGSKHPTRRPIPPKPGSKDGSEGCSLWSGARTERSKSERSKRIHTLKKRFYRIFERFRCLPDGKRRPWSSKSRTSPPGCSSMGPIEPRSEGPPPSPPGTNHRTWLVRATTSGRPGSHHHQSWDQFSACCFCWPRQTLPVQEIATFPRLPPSSALLR